MHLKCTKDELRNRLISKVYDGDSLRLSLDLNGSNGYQRGISQTIQDHIDFKLNNIINTLVDNIYTDEEFEQDIGLK